jgi:hypothetical protein
MAASKLDMALDDLAATEVRHARRADTRHPTYSRWCFPCWGALGRRPATRLRSLMGAQGGRGRGRGGGGRGGRRGGGRGGYACSAVMQSIRAVCGAEIARCDLRARRRRSFNADEGPSNPLARDDISPGEAAMPRGPARRQRGQRATPYSRVRPCAAGSPWLEGGRR